MLREEPQAAFLVSVGVCYSESSGPSRTGAIAILDELVRQTDGAQREEVRRNVWTLLLADAERTRKALGWIAGEGSSLLGESLSLAIHALQRSEWDSLEARWISYLATSPRAILLSEPANFRLEGSSLPWFQSRDLGIRHLPGWEQPQRVFGLGSLAGIDSNRQLPPNNLPIPGRRLVGRATEVSDLLDLIYRRGRLLVTLTGLSGSGKSRVATRVAFELTATLASSWLVNLANCRNEDDVIESVATSLRVVPASPEQPLEEAIEQHLARQDESLLILDSAEVLADLESNLIVRWNQVAPRVHILATSARPMGLEGEVEYPIAPLEHVGIDGVASAVVSPAAQLFIHAAKDADARFEVENDDLALIEDISRDLGGLPLAVELAAARTKVLDLADLRARIRETLDLVSTRSTAVPERHRDLSSAIAWSLGQLDQQEVAALGALCVFEHGFTVRSASAVLGSLGMVEDLPDVVDLVEQLHSRSLLTVAASTRERRFRIHTTVRTYYRSHVQLDIDWATARRAHSASVATMAGLAVSRFDAEPRETLDQLQQELADLKMVFGWAIESRETTMAATVADALWLLSRYRGLAQPASSRFERVLRLLSKEVPGFRSRARYIEAVRYEGRVSDAKRMAEDTLRALLPDWGDREEVPDITPLRSLPSSDEKLLAACALRVLGIGREPWLRAALDVADLSGDPHEITNGQDALALVLRNTGRFAEADELLTESIDRARAELWEPGRLLLSINLASSAYAQQDLDRAARLIRDARTHADELGEPMSIVRCATVRHVILEAQGDLPGALDELESAQSWLGAIAEIPRLQFKINVFSTERQLGLLTRAEETMRDIEDAARTVGDVFIQTLLQANRAEMLLHFGRVHEALTHIEAAIEGFERLDQPSYLGLAARLDGWARSLLLEWDASADRFGEAAVHYERRQDQEGKRAGRLERLLFHSVDMLLKQHGVSEEPPVEDVPVENAEDGLESASLGWRWLVAGDPARALELFDAAQDWFETRNQRADLFYYVSQIGMAFACLRTRDRREASEVLEELQAAFRDMRFEPDRCPLVSSALAQLRRELEEEAGEKSGSEDATGAATDQASMAEPIERDEVTETIDLGGWTEVENLQTTPEAVQPNSHASMPARSWGRFEMREVLGQGGFGVVYRCWDPMLERDVALKLYEVRDIPGTDPHDFALSEGRMLARVDCPNVVKVIDAAVIDGKPGLVMEFLKGRTLRELVDFQGPFQADEAIRIGSELCRALGAVHARNVVHRDVKAGNVMRVFGGRIVLMDFGIGLDLERISSHDNFGTLDYMAPELFEMKPANRTTDVYALGVLLFYLVTGEFPVSGRLVADFIKAHRLRQRRRLLDTRHDVPHVVAETIEKALSWDPGGRYASAHEFEAALEAAVPV